MVSSGVRPCGAATDDPDGDGDRVPYPGIFARVSDRASLEWIQRCFKDTELCGEPYTPTWCEHLTLPFTIPQGFTFY